jgi:hypothetical protein
MYTIFSKSILISACSFALVIGTVVQAFSIRMTLPPTTNMQAGGFPATTTGAIPIASNPIPPPLIGVWREKQQRKTDRLALNSDGSYYEVITTFGPPGGAYNNCSTANSRTIKGSFTINGNEITFHLKTLEVKNFAGCGGMPALTSYPKNYTYPNTYIIESFSLQNNGQTLVLTQTGGNVKSDPQSMYQKLP